MTALPVEIDPPTRPMPIVQPITEYPSTRAVRVPYCTCAGYGPWHEPSCGWVPAEDAQHVIPVPAPRIR